VFALSAEAKNKNVILILDAAPDRDMLAEYEVTLCKQQEMFAPINPIKRFTPHGTSIGLAIWTNLDWKAKSKSCLLFLNIFEQDEKYAETITRFEPLLSKVRNIKYANMSIDGDKREEAEEKLIESLLRRKVKINIAAGNKSLFLSRDGCYYAFPACIKYHVSKTLNANLITVVGGLEFKNSNFGTAVDVLENPCYVLPVKMCGTSQATAIFTAKQINKEN
jgi:hypothetical protein